jgi:hypothetical protein
MSDQPDIIAMHDQAVEEIKQSARIVASYYKQLRADGVDLYDALQLTLDFQGRLIFPVSDDAEGEA